MDAWCGGVAVVVGVGDFQHQWRPPVAHAVEDAALMTGFFKSLLYDAVFDLSASPAKLHVRDGDEYRSVPLGDRGQSWQDVEACVTDAMVWPHCAALGRDRAHAEAYSGAVVLYISSAASAGGTSPNGVCMYFTEEVVSLDKLVAQLGMWSDAAGRSGAATCAITDLYVDRLPRETPSVRARAAPGVGLLASFTPAFCPVFTPKLVDNAHEILRQGLCSRHGASEWPLTLLTVHSSFDGGERGWAPHIQRPSLADVSAEHRARMGTQGDSLWGAAAWEPILHACSLDDVSLVAPLATCRSVATASSLQRLVVAVDRTVGEKTGNLFEARRLMREGYGLASIGMPLPEQFQPLQFCIEADVSATHRQAWEDFRAAYALRTGELQHVENTGGRMLVYVRLGDVFPDWGRPGVSIGDAQAAEAEWDRLEETYAYVYGSGGRFYFGSDASTAVGKDVDGRPEGCKVYRMTLRCEGLYLATQHAYARLLVESRSGVASRLLRTQDGDVHTVSVTPLTGTKEFHSTMTGIRHHVASTFREHQEVRVQQAAAMDVSRAQHAEEAGYACADDDVASMCVWLKVSEQAAVEAAIRLQSVQRMVSERKRFRSILWQIGPRPHLAPLWYLGRRPLNGREQRALLRRWLAACSTALPWRVLSARIDVVVQTGCKGSGSLDADVDRWEEQRRKILGIGTAAPSLAQRCTQLLAGRSSVGPAEVVADGPSGAVGHRHFTVGLRVASPVAYPGDAVPLSARQHIHRLLGELHGVLASADLASEYGIGHVRSMPTFSPPASAALAVRSVISVRRRPWRPERWPGELPEASLPSRVRARLAPLSANWEGWLEVRPRDGRTAPVFEADRGGRPPSSAASDGTWEISGEPVAWLAQGTRVQQLPQPDGWEGVSAADAGFSDHWVLVRWEGPRQGVQRQPEMHTGYMRRSVVVDCAARALAAALSGDEQPLPFADLQADQRVCLVPPGSHSAERFVATVQAVSKPQGYVTLSWSAPADGGPPSAVGSRVEQQWWDGESFAVLWDPILPGDRLRVMRRMPDLPEPGTRGCVLRHGQGGALCVDFGSAGTHWIPKHDLPIFHIHRSTDPGEGGGSLIRTLEVSLLPGRAICAVDATHPAFQVERSEAARQHFQHLLQVSRVIYVAERRGRATESEELAGVRQDGLKRIQIRRKRPPRVNPATLMPTVRLQRQLEEQCSTQVFRLQAARGIIGAPCHCLVMVVVALLAFFLAVMIVGVSWWVRNVLALVYLNDMTSLSLDTVVSWVLAYFITLLVAFFTLGVVIGVVRAKVSYKMNTAILFICAKYSRLIGSETVALLRTEDVRHLTQRWWVQFPMSVAGIVLLLGCLGGLAATSAAFFWIAIGYLCLQWGFSACYDAFTRRHVEAVRRLDVAEQLRWVLIRGPKWSVGNIALAHADDRQMRLFIVSRARKLLSTENTVVHAIANAINWFFLLALLPFMFYVGAWQVARPGEKDVQMAQQPEELVLGVCLFLSVMLLARWVAHRGDVDSEQESACQRVLTVLLHCPLSDADREEIRELLDLAEDDEKLRERLGIPLPQMHDDGSPATPRTGQVVASYGTGVTSKGLLLKVDWLEEVFDQYPASALLLYVCLVLWVVFACLVAGFASTSWASECESVSARCWDMDIIDPKMIANTTRSMSLVQTGNIFGRCQLLLPIAYSLKQCLERLQPQKPNVTVAIEFDTWQAGRVGFYKRFSRGPGTGFVGAGAYCPTADSAWQHYRTLEEVDITRHEAISETFSRAVCDRGPVTFDDVVEPVRVTPLDPPTRAPFAAPSTAPTGGPQTPSPTAGPTGPTASPTAFPTAPTRSPTSGPTAPTDSPSAAPTARPTAGPAAPTRSPSAAPTRTPSAAPTAPTRTPSTAPAAPTTAPTAPTGRPTAGPTGRPSA
eukprot:TRINITY_DN6257_c0_g1_i1.p1 TRINITY_DN6257_c0_g1~~TRINITY_DN6257_c0_g1_i1.p1  ORF type:complete len:1901 (+),score=513.32 TRINITY_DN6257_c0_g1_i1:47-5749(+)